MQNFLRKLLGLHKNWKRKHSRVLFIATACVICSVCAFAQQLTDKKIRISFREEDLITCLKRLQTASAITFVYQPSDLRQVYTTVTGSFAGQPLSAILNQVLNGSGFSWQLMEGKVVVRKTETDVHPAAGQQEMLITGQVTDGKNNAPIPGVIIYLKGTRTNVLTDANGNFKIKVPDQNAVLVVSYIGYTKKEIRVGNRTTFKVVLELDVKSLAEVTVSARRKVSTENELLKERKNSAIVSDGISAQNIEKTASITTAQALQRVTGVTITDDKYVAIRGLGDRSVVGELNGARLSSSDPDRSTVPLDLIPANLLDNITVYKTASPDHPADASAGIVELKTKSVPTELTIQLVAQGGFNTNVGLGGKVNGFYHDDLGFFGQRVKEHDLTPGFNALKDQYPGGLPQIQKLFIESRYSQEAAAEAYRVNGLMRSFDPVLSTSYRNAKPNQIYSIAFGNSFDVFHGHKLGVILSASYYNRTEDIYQGELNQYSIYQGVVTGDSRIFSPLHIPSYITPDFPRLEKYLSYKENTGKQQLNYGSLVGLTYKFNTRHEIQAQYIGSSGAESIGSNLDGAWTNTGLTFPVYNVINQLKQTYRKFNTFNFQGEHKLLNRENSTRISYNLSTSTSRQNNPDYRFSNLAHLSTTRYIDESGIGLGSDIYALVFGTVHGIGKDGAALATNPNGRSFRNLEEHNYNFKGDLTQPFTIKGQQQLFKAGYNFLRRERSYGENILGLPPVTGSAFQGDMNQLVSYQNIGLQPSGTFDDEGAPRLGGFLYQIQKSPNNYRGTYETQAFYGMVDLHLVPQLRLTGGVRFESTDIRAQVDTTNVNAGGQGFTFKTSRPGTGLNIGYKPYYSANLTYTLQEDMNFRLAYSTALARPELREITSISQFDPFQFAVVIGNPALKNQETKSADFRWEWFPNPGEVIAVSVFGKIIDHQLNKVFLYTSQGSQAVNTEFPAIQFQNDPNQGKVYGIELEVKKNLSLFSPRLKNLYVGSNFLLAASYITKNAARLNASRTIDRYSPEKTQVFEQAPYSINVYLDFVGAKTGTNITTSFNMVGSRLIQVQLDGAPDIFDRPAPVLDFVFSQRLNKHFSAKGFAKNILDPAFMEVYTTPGSEGKYHGETYVRRKYYKGMELALGITYSIF